MNKTPEQMIVETEFVVEATHEEFMGIWRQFADDAMFLTPMNKYSFEHISMGSGPVIGEFGGMPVAITIFWQIINGVLVAFYEGTSVVVHHGMIRDWVKGNFPCLKKYGGWRYRYCNVANIHHLLNYIDEKNKLPKQ